MAARGSNRRPRQPRVVPVDVQAKIDNDEVAKQILRDFAASSPQRCFGRIVSYRINSTGVDEFRPAIILRDDGADLATLFVFTLPGDEIAAGARVAQQRAVSRPKGLEVGQWQLVPAP